MVYDDNNNNNKNQLTQKHNTKKNESKLCNANMRTHRNEKE